MNSKAYREAEGYCRQAIELREDFAEIWVGLGFVLWRQGKEAEARQAFETALALHRSRFERRPDDTNQLLQQVVVLALLDRETEAEALYREAQAKYPNDQFFSAPASVIRDFKKMRDGE